MAIVSSLISTIVLDYLSPQGIFLALSREHWTNWGIRSQPWAPFPQTILGDIYHILSEMLLVFTNSFPRGFLTISMGWRHTMGFLRRNQRMTSISYFPAASAWFSHHHGILEDVYWFDKLGKGLWQSGGSPNDHVSNHGEATKSSISWLSPGAQSRLTLCDPMDGSPSCSSVHGIFQARLLEWVGISTYINY